MLIIYYNNKTVNKWGSDSTSEHIDQSFDLYACVCYVQKATLTITKYVDLFCALTRIISLKCKSALYRLGGNPVEHITKPEKIKKTIQINNT